MTDEEQPQGRFARPWQGSTLPAAPPPLHVVVTRTELPVHSVAPPTPETEEDIARRALARAMMPADAKGTPK
jgi:hypothetical protein